MAKKPSIKKSALACLNDGTEYTAENYDRGGYFIGGLDGGMHIESREEAEAIAAALNLASRYKALQRRTALLAAEVNAFIDG